MGYYREEELYPKKGITKREKREKGLASLELPTFSSKEDPKSN